MIYDTFIFFNELDILELRLNTLMDRVDYFVLVESTITFQGNEKPLFYGENKDRFSKFNEKIIHIVVENTPLDVNPFEREYFQRDAILRGLKTLDPEDLVMISDVDEIPNLDMLPLKIKDKSIYAFEQDLYYYKLNFQCKNFPLLPWTILLKYKDLESPSVLRRRLADIVHANILAGNPDYDIFRVIKNGGWHFSYMGSCENIISKIEAFSHTEYNVKEFKNAEYIKNSIEKGSDIFGRGISTTPVALGLLPSFVAENKNKFEINGLVDSRYSDPYLSFPSKTILFDQYSRYRACAELLVRLGATPENKILDIGSGTSCLLSEFLPTFNIDYVDPLIADLAFPKKNQYALSLDEVESKLGVYDFVIAIDVLEHVRENEREKFVESLVALAEKGVVLSFPHSDTEVPINLDRSINDEYTNLNGRSYSWLREHIDFGLPSEELITEFFKKKSLTTGRFGHGYVAWLRPLLSLTIHLWERESTRKLAFDASAYFNENLYRYDYCSPCYRTFLVAMRSDLPKGWKPNTAIVDDEARSMFDSFMHLFLGVGLLKVLDNQERDYKNSVSLNEKLIYELSEVNKKLFELYRSRSWRITSFPRVLMKSARKIVNNLKDKR